MQWPDWRITRKLRVADFEAVAAAEEAQAEVARDSSEEEEECGNSDMNMSSTLVTWHVVGCITCALQVHLMAM